MVFFNKITQRCSQIVARWRQRNSQVDKSKRAFLKTSASASIPIIAATALPATATFLISCVKPQLGQFKVEIKMFGFGRPKINMDRYHAGKMSDKFYFDNFAPYIPKKGHSALKLYIRFCKKYRKHMYDGGLLRNGAGDTFDVQKEVAKFSQVAKYYTSETQKILAHFGTCQIDDISTAFAISRSPELKKYLGRKAALIKVIQKKVKNPFERKLAPKYFVTDISKFSIQDLFKIYILQKYLLSDQSARTQLWDLVIEDLSPAYSDTEIGGGINLNPDTLKCKFTPIQGDRGENGSYVAVNSIDHARASSFSAFHLHATSGKNERKYAGPSIQDIHSSHLQSGVVITPVGEKRINVHYYRSLGKTPQHGVISIEEKLPPQRGISYNLGSFLVK